MTDDDCIQDEHTIKSKKAELQALIAKTARDLQALERTERQQQLERRRENVAEYSATGKTLVPASPSPRKEKTKKVFVAKDALMRPVKTDRNPHLLASHHRRVESGLYSALPDFQRDHRNAGSSSSSSSHPIIASSSSSSNSRSRNSSTSDLKTLMEDDARSRLAAKQRLPPSNLLDAAANARMRLKNAESQRGVAHLRSSAFSESAPKRLPPPPQANSSTTTSSSATIPIPSYETSYKHVKNGNHSSSSTNGNYTTSNMNYTNTATIHSHSAGASAAYKGKSVERGPPDSQREPATSHAWSTRLSATTTNTNSKPKNNEEDYYSFEEEDGDGDDERAYMEAEGYDNDEDAAYQEIPYKSIGNERNDDLSLVHRIKPGPKRFKRLESDPNFDGVEPNSKIYLSKRVLPHDELQEHLSDRYYLNHDLLYSIVRPSKGGLEYEVPVEGDWIIIGVLAEKSEIKYTGGGGIGLNGGQQNGALKQMEWRKKMEEERKAKAREAMKEKMRDKFRDKNNVDGNNVKPYDDSAFDELAKDDDELREAFEGSDGEMMRLDSKNGKKGKNGNNKEEEEREPPQRRRYITFKLIDLGRKNGGGGTGVLSLKLFESDPNKRRQIKRANDSDEEEIETVINKKTGKKTLVTRSKKEKRLAAKTLKDHDKEGGGNESGDDDRFERKEYKGGSGGAFEKFWKETNGTVIAILNPRIMKPWQNASTYQGPNANVLSITPESADSIIVIGKSRDLGSCQAKKKDGNLCSAWCDTRVDNICDYHIQQAVHRRRAGRAELLSGTGGMQTTNITGDINSLHSQKKPASRIFSGGSTYSHPYDPVNKVGLLPRNNTSVQEGQKTYVVSRAPTGGAAGASHGAGTGGYKTGLHGAPRPVSSSSYRSDMNDSHTSKKQLDPSELAEKRAREKMRFKKLLEMEGGKSVGAKYLHTNGKAPTSNSGASASSGLDGEDSAASQSEMDGDKGDGKTKKSKKKRVFGVESLRKIGYDPTAMPAQMDAKSQKRKIEAMQILGNPESYEAKLGRHPGKGHSNVTVPRKEQAPPAAQSVPEEPGGREEEDDDSDAPRPPKRRTTTASKHDSGFQDSSADDQPVQKTQSKTVTAYTQPNNAAPESDEESDLEIEPPILV